MFTIFQFQVISQCKNLNPKKKKKTSINQMKNLFQFSIDLEWNFHINEFLSETL
jgi:hypothetical protein